MPILSINASQWFILAFIFIGLSFVIARRIPASIAGSALMVGFTTWGLNAFLSPSTLGIAYQLILFFFFLAMALYFSSAPLTSTPKSQTASVDVGRVFTLSSPIQGGHGLVTLENKKWNLIGKDQAIHTRVVVVSKEGDTLYVRTTKEDPE